MPVQVTHARLHDFPSVPAVILLLSLLQHVRARVAPSAMQASLKTLRAPCHVAATLEARCLAPGAAERAAPISGRQSVSLATASRAVI